MADEDNAIIEELRKWTACDVADGLSSLGETHGGFLEGITMFSPEFQSGSTKIVGKAFTVKMVLKSETNAPKVQGNYIDKVPKGSVVFMSQPTPHVNACYGGLMSMRAQYLGAEGTIVDGRVRDLQEHRDLKFPVFSRFIGTTAATAVSRPSEINVPVKLQSSVQDATIRPGDFIIADLDGVVCVPRELARKVLDAIPPKAKADAKTAEAIKKGMSVEEAFKTFRGK
ncbi:hypothetical protein PRZ48_008370 [Zasmidium cellare]|uniref:Uncharacterized protein n=1 Tax=Zasmidium cellare TaxID=395010 RepID=A0ABR0EF98_ZASCE|nr:hypothetical protein PRZ48_008370 [Zasmidium cellare]